LSQLGHSFVSSLGRIRGLLRITGCGQGGRPAKKEGTPFRPEASRFARAHLGGRKNCSGRPTPPLLSRQKATRSSIGGQAWRRNSRAPQPTSKCWGYHCRGRSHDEECWGVRVLYRLNPRRSVTSRQRSCCVRVPSKAQHVAPCLLSGSIRTGQKIVVLR